jgi:peptide/nickel transport system substrate-binding protein
MDWQEQTLKHGDGAMPEPLAQAELSRRRLFEATAALAVGASAFMAPGAAAAIKSWKASAAAKIPDTFVYSMPGPLVSLNPDGAGQNDLASVQAWPAAYDSLLDFTWPTHLAVSRKIIASKGITGLVKPVLATHWDVSKDGKTYRFYVRQGVKSQYGNELSADDVLWSLQKSFAAKATGAFFLSFLGGLASADGVKNINDQTVEVRLPAPQEEILLALGWYQVVIYDSTEAKKHGTTSDPYANKWLDQNTAGFGPYELTSFGLGGDRVAFQRRDDYWGKPPAVKQFVQQNVSDASNRLSLLLAGQTHYASELSPLQYQLVKKRGFRVEHVDNTQATLMWLERTPPWDDPTVRAAVARAIPYNDILASVFQGQALPLKSILPAFVAGSTSEFWNYNTNLDAAKAVLAPLKQSLTISYQDGVPTDEQTAILIQSALMQAGLTNVSLQKVPASIFVGKALQGAYPAWLNRGVTPGVPTPHYYFSIYGGKGGFFNPYKYSNPKLEALIPKTASKNPAVWKPAVREGQKIFMDDLIVFPIAYTGVSHATAPILDIPITHTGNGFVFWKDLKIRQG